MDVKTKFGLGDKVSTIAKNKVKDFTIDAIIIKEDGIYYRDSQWESYEEECCFGSRQEVCDYILGNTDYNNSNPNNNELI